MEDDLNIFKNERRPQLFQEWKMTSILSKTEDDHIFFSKMEDDLNFLKETKIWKYEQNSLLSKTKVKQRLYTDQVMCITFVLTSQWIYG